MTSVLFPEPDTPVTQTSKPRGISTSRCCKLLAPAPRRRSRRQFGTLRVPGDGGWCPSRDEMTTVFTRSWPQVKDVVGCQNGLAIVLDHQDGVAQITQAFEALEQALIIALMQANARLVEDIEHPHQARANLRCQANALAFPTGEGCCRAI